MTICRSQHACVSSRRTRTRSCASGTRSPSKACPSCIIAAAAMKTPTFPTRSLSDVGRAAQIQIQASVHAGQPQQAEATLNTLIASGTAPGSDIAHLSHRVAASYMAEAQDDGAVRVASAVTGVDRAAQPLLDWDEGLANYRLGQYQESAQHFETLAQTGSVPNYTRSAAAFWAARAHMAAGDPLRVVTLLTAATREQPTFYGLLAEKTAGTAVADDVLRTGARRTKLRRHDADSGRASRCRTLAGGTDAGPRRRNGPRAHRHRSSPGRSLCGARASSRSAEPRIARLRNRSVARRDADGPLPRAALCADERLSRRSFAGARLHARGKPFPSRRRLQYGRARTDAADAGHGAAHGPLAFRRRSSSKIPPTISISASVI